MPLVKRAPCSFLYIPNLASVKLSASVAAQGFADECRKISKCKPSECFKCVKFLNVESLAFERLERITPYVADGDSDFVDSEGFRGNDF